MKTLNSLLLFTMFVSQVCLAQNKQIAYPSYKEVVNQFYSRYTTEHLLDGEIFNLARKPDGWHSIIRNYDNKVILDELFWSKSKNEYLELTFSHYVQGSIDQKHNQMLNDTWINTMYTMVPYWGYEGWENDVIGEFGKRKHLPDSLLNGLARAYSSMARNITRQSEFTGPDNYNKLPKGQNALNGLQLKNYLKYQHLSIKTYYKLYQQNRNYETFVSDIFNVYSNEVMNGFLTLRYVQDEKTAQKELKDGLYSGFYLEMARNILNSCQENAILFTNGDMDTYPLLYVQEKEKFRQDILVVNLSLLNLGRYINHMINFTGLAQPLKCSLNSEIYKNETKPYFFITDKLSRPVLANEIFKEVESIDPVSKIRIGENQFIDNIPSRDIYFKINQQYIPNEFSFWGSSIDSALYMHYERNYMLISEFCLLDIIATNNFKRPLYFSATIGNESFDFISDYLTFEGLVYQIAPVKHRTENKRGDGTIYPDILNDKLFGRVKFNPENYQNLFENQKNMISLYFITFSRLLNSLNEAQEKDKIIKLLDYFETSFPTKTVLYNYYVFPMISVCFDAGLEKRGTDFVRHCKNSIQKEIEKKVIQKNQVSGHPSINFEIYSLNELNSIAKQYLPEAEISAEIEELYNKHSIFLQD